uniref:Uncharacterized protein n=1 Tax=Sphaerodactylus townsendi TaxID=933632 RepID=A0ACB8FUX1_9SAUR
MLDLQAAGARMRCILGKAEIRQAAGSSSGGDVLEEEARLQEDQDDEEEAMAMAASAEVRGSGAGSARGALPPEMIKTDRSGRRSRNGGGALTKQQLQEAAAAAAAPWRPLKLCISAVLCGVCFSRHVVGFLQGHFSSVPVLMYASVGASVMTAVLFPVMYKFATSPVDAKPNDHGDSEALLSSSHLDEDDNGREGNEVDFDVIEMSDALRNSVMETSKKIQGESSSPNSGHPSL